MKETWKIAMLQAKFSYKIYLNYLNKRRQKMFGDIENHKKVSCNVYWVFLVARQSLWWLFASSFSKFSLTYLNFRQNFLHATCFFSYIEDNVRSDEKLSGLILRNNRLFATLTEKKINQERNWTRKTDWRAHKYQLKTNMRFEAFETMQTVTHF